MATVSTHMTTDELLALPESATDRWLIAEELRERPMIKSEASLLPNPICPICAYLSSGYLNEVPCAHRRGLG
jgi:hypothetical protein